MWAPGGVLLLEGRDEAYLLVMQFKEATTAVLGAVRGGQHGQRVVEGQRYMQAASDIFLGQGAR